MNTDTPRTDANIYVPSRTGTQWVRAEFARELERELNDGQHKLAILAAEVDATRHDLDRWMSVAEKMEAVLDDSYTVNSNTEKIDALAEFDLLKRRGI